ncbi:MAG TPA: DUF1622 domain-containing protein [Methanomassiliicoccales archaeon]|nr:DUF1622 domain-containing protein [Methanomassiliicoccales archaeon]
MDPLLFELMTILSDILAVAGVLLIFYAGIMAFILFLLNELRNRTEHSNRKIRHNFTHRMILGLDFLIGADIILTVVKGTLDEVSILAVVVAIRIALTLSLIKEASEIEKLEQMN